MESFRSIQEITLILGVAFLGTYIFIKLKKPVILGYLVAGVFLGLNFFSRFINPENTSVFAEFGVALLLFTTGVEFSFDAISKVKKIALLGGVLQIVISVLFFYTFLGLFKFSQYESFFLASAFSFSSTALLVKLLEENKGLQTRQGEISLSWLVIQDICVVFFLVFLKLFGTNEGINAMDIFSSFLKSIMLIVFSLTFGKYIIPKILEVISRLNSEEALLIISLFFCITIALITEKLGLSYTLGAFLGGLMISQSFLNHQIVSEIKPIRNLFSLIFFVSIGTLFSFSFFISNFFKIIIFTLVIIFIKFIIVFILSLFLGKHSRTAFMIGLNLASISEFAFVISTIGLKNSWISKDIYSIVISVTILTLFLAPFLINNSENLYNKLRDFIKKKSIRLYRLLFIRYESIKEVDQPNIKNHVVICGYGRVGSYVGRVLNRLNIQFVVIESDSDLFSIYKNKTNIIYGDATNTDILDKADVERAKVLIIALPSSISVDLVSDIAKKINPMIKIITRAHLPAQIEKLRKIGIRDAIEPEFEAAVEISKRTLRYLGKSNKNVEDYLKRSRAQLL